MGLHRFLAIITVTLLGGLVLAVWFLPASEDFRAENTLWNGISRLGAGYPYRSLDSLSGLPPEPPGATLITIPYTDYAAAELEQLKSFVTRGGRLILADDYGYGNRVLEYLGLGARFSGAVLLDPLVNYKNENFPRIVHLEPDPLTENYDNLAFNHATGLTDVPAGNILALSSSFSYLDSNGDGTQQEDEPAGPLPVISRHEIGRGQVVLVADPSIFINGMEDIGGNAAFIKNIVATSPSLYIDQSHLKASELHRTRSWLGQARRLLATLVGTVLLVITAITAALAPLRHRKSPDVRPA